MTASISVITVTFNCAHLLPALIDSLKAQSDQDFEWVVVDGASTDETIRVVEMASRTVRTKYISEPDFGIYHALNKAVALTTTDYYLVVGADDLLYSDAVERYRKLATNPQVDMVAASVFIGSRLATAGRGKAWLRGGNAFVASHAVGTLIKRELHSRFGFYSNRYVNCADMHFVRAVMSCNTTRFVADNFIAGQFCVEGVSTVDRVCSLSDFFRIQLRFEKWGSLQAALYLLRLIRLLPALLRRPETTSPSNARLS